jgi:hypothetical protein
LLSCEVGGKVDAITRRRAAPFPRRPHLEVALTARLRELIQQLGEAIHESVIESEQIAGVVQDIREYGFDVLLMLEATIGLNEVEKDSEPDSEDEEKASPTEFTSNDLSFLRSLRISIEGEEKAELPESTSSDKPENPAASKGE